MVTPSFVRDAGAAFSSWKCCQSREPILREYVRIAPSGRPHFPLPVGAPLSDVEAIAGQYPVYRIDPSCES